MTEVTISDPCGRTDYDDEKHRRNPGKKDFPPKGTASIFESEQKNIGFEPTITNAGECREEGNGLDISEGKGATIKAFDGGIEKHNKQKEPEAK